MCLHCCILAFFPPRMCLSTLENKIRFFFFVSLEYTTNSKYVTHDHTHTHWFETPLTSRGHLNTHIHSSASVCGHHPSLHSFPREHERTIMHLCPGWRGSLSKRVFPLVSHHSDLSVWNAEVQLHWCFYVALLLRAARSLGSIHRYTVLEVINKHALDNWLVILSDFSGC